MVGRPGKYQPRFTAGEIDPLLEGNTDEGAYLKGAALMQNVRPLPQGGFTQIWGTTALGTIPALGDGSPSNVKLVGFSSAPSQIYDICLSHQRGDVFGPNGWLASFAIAHTSAQIAEISAPQQLSTMLLFHQDVSPQRVRRASDVSWLVDAPPFANIPNYDFGDVTYTNGVASVWLLGFFNASGGNNYLINVNGVDSATAAYTGTAATDAANLQALIDALPGLAPGVTVTAGGAFGSMTPGGVAVPAGKFGVEFSGTDNQGDGWAISGRVVDNGSAAITAAHVKSGVLGGEPVMSNARGWPACGLIYGQRLLVGGFKGLGNAFLASQAGNYWNFDTRLSQASAPMLVPIDTKGAATIREMHLGRTLEIFTDEGEYWLNDTGLDRTKTPPIVAATNNGVKSGVRVTANEAASIYVDKSGGALWEYKFDYTQQNYASATLSVRSSSLASGLIDATLRRLTSATKANEHWSVRSDGMAVLLSLLRAEEIAAYARRATDGQFVAVNCNDRRELTFIVRRTVGNAIVQSVERETPGVLLDGAINFAFGAPQTAVTGLGVHEGRTVWAIADGFPQGPFRVSGGAIALNFPASAGYVGRWTPPRVLTLPQPRDIAPRTVSRRPCRVHTVRVLVQNTSSIAIGANDQPAVDVDLARYGQPTDQPPILNPYSGWIAVEGLQGYSQDGTVEITQLRPGLLTVLGVVVEVDL
ncbi:MAG: hypothetical protein ACR650_09810 [Methylocystis sp.]